MYSEVLFYYEILVTQTSIIVPIKPPEKIEVNHAIILYNKEIFTEILTEKIQITYY